MILDHVSRAEKYYNVHTSFRHAFDYLKLNDVSKFNDGIHEINGDEIFLIVARGKSNDVASKLESHRHYIDIQVALDGSYPLGWKNLDRCKSIDTEYDHEKDAQTFSDTPEFTVELEQGMFAVVFPEDAHVGLPPKKNVLKAVVKVAL